MCRFYSEEAYSFRVRDIAPGALRVLDMQDMHCLRKGAQVPYAVMHQHMHYQCCGAIEQGHFGEIAPLHAEQGIQQLCPHMLYKSHPGYMLCRDFTSLTFAPNYATHIG